MSGNPPDYDRVIPVHTLLDAYSRGIFPMAEEGRILWFSPEKRGVIPLDERFHVPKSLRKTIKRRPFEIRWDTAFHEVVRNCADRDHQRTGKSHHQANHHTTSQVKYVRPLSNRRR